MNFKLALASIGWLWIASDAESADNTPEIPINHIVYIIQENITFDHYFGTYPGADGIPADLKLPFRPSGKPEFGPFHLNKTAIPHDLNHSWQYIHCWPDSRCYRVVGDDLHRRCRAGRVGRPE